MNALMFGSQPRAVAPGSCRPRGESHKAKDIQVRHCPSLLCRAVLDSSQPDKTKEHHRDFPLPGETPEDISLMVEVSTAVEFVAEVVSSPPWLVGDSAKSSGRSAH